MKILITGVAGFIGAAVGRRLLEEGHQVVGIDNINDYYSTSLKFDRLALLGIPCKKANVWEKETESKIWHDFNFIRIDIRDKQKLQLLFEKYSFDYVIHLAAQPGVRYSLSHPDAYVENNINGFMNVLEGCRNTHVKHLVFASSSSVYGLNGKTPFSEKDTATHPISLYAATKLSNELIAHSYSFIYDLPVTGLRFFTVYGPWNRPDMSLVLFIEGIMKGKPIKVFNNGEMWRDFTYIDDIAECVVRAVNKIPTPNKDWDSMTHDPSSSPAPFRIYNVGNQKPMKLIDYIAAIEKELGKSAIKEMLPMQSGDLYQTYSDSSSIASLIGFTPDTKLEDGIHNTVEWFKRYYKC